MADILSQILQGGLMNYGASNALDRGLMGGDPSMQLGMQLLANSNTPGNFAGILGRSMLGTQEAQQKNAQQQLALMQQGIGTQQAVQMFPYLQQAMGQAFGQPGQPGQQGGQPQDPNSTPGIGPGGSPVSAAPQGAPGPAGGPQSMANLGGMLALMGRPGGQQLIDLAKYQSENDPANVTRLAAAKGEIAVDQAALQTALKGGNVPAAQAAYTKFLKDAGMLTVGAMNGDVTTFGGITPQSLGMSNVNPARGTQTVGGVQSPIPGAPQTQQALAAGTALGEAAGKPFESTDASGVKTVAPLASVLGGRAPGLPNAPTVAPVSPKQAAAGDPKLTKALSDPEFRAPVLRPGQSASPAMVEARNVLMKDSSDATTAAGQALQYLKAAQNIMTSKGAPTVALPGQIRAQVGSVFGTVNASNYQEVAKYLGNAALTGAKSIYGARMTASEVGLQLNELSPSVKMTEGAIKDLLGTNIRNTQYTIDTADRARAYIKAGNDPMSFGQWNQQYWPRAETVNTSPGAVPIGQPQTIGGFTVTRIK